MSTFVSVGNATQAFPRLLNAVASVASQLPQPVFIQYGAHDAFTCGGCESAAFVSMTEFERRVLDATLLIMHAGAGSVIHAIHAGKMPVVMARSAGLGEHVDDHQQEFARELGRLGKLVLWDDPALLLSAVADATGVQEAQTEPGPVAPLVATLTQLLQDHADSLQHPL